VTWGFIWLMFVLKIPIFMLFGIVWWAVKKTGDEPEPVDEAKVRPAPHPPSRARRPRRPRDPHGGAMPLSPPRIRKVTAISREHADR
jgi:hypothetical protein